MKNLMLDVTSVVNKIYEEHGEVKASVLVDEARPEDSIAHPAFEWADDIAAQEYRLHQARQLIRRVSVIYNDEPTRLVNVPVLRLDAEISREGSYKPLPVVVSDPEYFEAALAAAVHRLTAAQVAVDDLRKAANKLDLGDRNAMIAQVSSVLATLNMVLTRASH